VIRRFLAVLHARNIEFVRDRSTLGWNLILPVVLVFGLATVFSSPDRAMFKVGVLSQHASLSDDGSEFLKLEYVDFIKVTDTAAALRKVERHQLDMLLDLRADPPRYWINDESRESYLVERLLGSRTENGAQRQMVSGKEVRRIDWLVPGILGMNMMFSCLFGVGYVVVRYRKNGFLKRLSATPLNAVEFAAAQIVSRMLLIMAITIAVYAGTNYFLDFRMDGSYFNLLLVAVLGAFSMVAMGFAVAARLTSEELAGGLLNVVSWPMMILSGVWFSLEGTNPVVQKLALMFPLTHMLNAARAIMLDGAGIGQIMPEIGVLLVMSAALLGVGAAMFRWQSD